MMANLDATLSIDMTAHRECFSLIKALTCVDFFSTSRAALRDPNNDLLTLIIPQWLAVFFPGLVQLTFSESGTRINFSGRLYPFLHAIHTQCPRMQTVTLDGESYDVSSFFSEVEIAPPSAGGLQLPDLPDDIFYVIFKHLAPTDIYTLSTLCRRLSLLAIPAYLSRRCTPDSGAGWRLSIRRRNAQAAFTDLSALRRLSSVTSIQCLTINIFTTGSLFIAFNYLQRLQRLITGLPAVEEVRLHFSLTSSARIVVDDIFMERWEMVLGPLLDAIVEKSCVSLTIIGCQYFRCMHNLPSVYHPMPPEVWRSSRLPIPPNVQYSFKLDSDIFLRSPLLKWVMSTVKRLPTTSLCMTRVSSDTFTSIWHIVESLPGLTHLHLAGRPDFADQPWLCWEATDVLAVIDKLPLLVSLSLGPFLSIAVGEVQSRDTIPQLLHLEMLSAQGEFITLLMQSRDGLPLLRSLTVITRDTWGTPADFTRISCIVKWFQKSNSSPFLSLNSAMPEVDWIDHFVEEYNTDEYQCLLGAVKSLVLRRSDLSGTLYGKALAKWLSIFPAVVRVSLEVFKNKPRITRVLQEIYEECPLLRKVELMSSFEQM
jgi:hypothetical protein